MSLKHFVLGSAMLAASAAGLVSGVIPGVADGLKGASLADRTSPNPVADRAEAGRKEAERRVANDLDADRKGSWAARSFGAAIDYTRGYLVVVPVAEWTGKNFGGGEDFLHNPNPHKVKPADTHTGHKTKVSAAKRNDDWFDTSAHPELNKN